MKPSIVQRVQSRTRTGGPFLASATGRKVSFNKRSKLGKHNRSVASVRGSVYRSVSRSSKG